MMTKTMNEVRTKYRSLLLGLGVAFVAVGAALVITGCNQGGSTTDTQPVAQTESKNSSTQESEVKTGQTNDAVHDMKAHTHTTKLDFSSQPEALPVGKPATWTLKILDEKSGQPVKDFETVHEKLMHLIVVSRDLSWFNHLHPAYKGNGVFTVTATLPREGTYKFYADYTPKGKEQEVPQHEVTTGGGQPAPIAASLVAGKAQNGWLVKNVTSHPEGVPEAKGGATYQVALMPMPSTPTAGQATMLHFQIRDAKGKPIKDLQPYLGAMGHCVILSQDTTEYLHSHPMEGGDMAGMKGMNHGDMKGMDMKNMNHSAPPKSGGSDVMFHSVFPSAGLYKAWGQFKHKGQIITAAFVVNVAPGSGAAATDESKPHTH